MWLRQQLEETFRARQNPRCSWGLRPPDSRRIWLCSWVSFRKPRADPRRCCSRPLMASEPARCVRRFQLLRRLESSQGTRLGGTRPRSQSGPVQPPAESADRPRRANIWPSAALPEAYGHTHPARHYTPVAELDAWVLAETGWFGACRYQVKLAHGRYIAQSHLVPAWALRPATDFDIAQERVRGNAPREPTQSATAEASGKDRPVPEGPSLGMWAHRPGMGHAY